MYRVMHVDDDPDILEITRLALAELGGFNVAQFRSGIDALIAYPRFLPDLILLDVIMPELSGEETFQRFNERFDLGRTPIVFMTGEGNRSARGRLMALGATDIILKPFNPITLAAQLEDLVAVEVGAVDEGSTVEIET